MGPLVECLVIKGPPESPLQLSLPEKEFFKVSLISYSLSRVSAKALFRFDLLALSEHTQAKIYFFLV